MSERWAEEEQRIDEGALIIIIITMDGRRCSSKFIAYGMQESK